MPASPTPMAAITAMQPAGMSSMAARVEIGEAQDAGVASSSRAGMKRSAKGRPTRRGWPARKGLVPGSRTLRRPFLSRLVVNVAVVTCDRMAMADAFSGVRLIAAICYWLNCATDTRQRAAVEMKWWSADILSKLNDSALWVTIIVGPETSPRLSLSSYCRRLHLVAFTLER